MFSNFNKVLLFIIEIEERLALSTRTFMAKIVKTPSFPAECHITGILAGTLCLVYISKKQIIDHIITNYWHYDFLILIHLVPARSSELFGIHDDSFLHELSDIPEEPSLPAATTEREEHEDIAADWITDEEE